MPPQGPRAWANRVSMVLEKVLGDDRYPVNVPEVAVEFSRQFETEDRIIRVEGTDLPGFDGALVRIPRKGWGILYNTGIASPGRVNYTLGHELGHYLVHRARYPQGLRCSSEDLASGSGVERIVEREADQFAADLLMPYPDLRKHLPPASIPDMDALSALAQRYRVSLLALIYRWLSYTERRALLVISRDGFIWRSRSSEAALRSGAFFRAAAETIELPAASLAARQDMVLDNRTGVLHPPGVWFQEEAKEMAIFSEQYEMTISLLLLGDAPERRWHSDDEDPVAVAVDRWMR